MNESHSEEYNRLFQQASLLVQDELPLGDTIKINPVDDELRERIGKAKDLFLQTLELEPASWQAMWFLGKCAQRLDDKAGAFEWLERASQANPGQIDVVRDAATAAMELGDNEAAITFAARCVEMEPENARLRARLAFAYLLAGKIFEAEANAGRALELDPRDPMAQYMVPFTRYYSAGTETPPNTHSAFMAEWQRKASTGVMRPPKSASQPQETARASQKSSDAPPKRGDDVVYDY